MNCQTCGGETVVLETRGTERRRHCRDGCGGRFTTVEVLKTEHDRLAEAIKDARELAERLTAAG